MSAVPKSTIWRSAIGVQSRLQNSSRSEEHTSELQSRFDLVCRLLLEKKKNKANITSLQSELDRLAGRYAGDLTHLSLTKAKDASAPADIQPLHPLLLGIHTTLSTRSR